MIRMRVMTGLCSQWIDLCDVLRTWARLVCQSTRRIPEASTENASERNDLLASKPVGIPPSMCLPNILSFYWLFASPVLFPCQCSGSLSTFLSVYDISTLIRFYQLICPMYPHWLTILVDRMSGPGSRFMTCIIVVAVCVSPRQHIDSIPSFFSEGQ